MRPGRGSYIIGDDGVTPVLCEDLDTWGEWMGSGNRVVKQETVRGKFISTVFLGVDHSFSDIGPPILYETMVFSRADAGGGEIHCERASTRAEALANHEEAVRMVVADDYREGV